MSISRLPNSRWRAQVYDPSTGKNVSVAKVLGAGPASYATKREAKQAREDARRKLAKRKTAGMTVATFRDRWLTDPLFATDKESTRLHYRERTSQFADRYGTMLLTDIDDTIVAQWLALGKASTVPALRTMFNDAASKKAGRLIETNPFAGLGLKRSKGRSNVDPPSEQMVRSTYGHRDRERALQRVQQAYQQRGNVRPLREARREQAG